MIELLWPAGLLSVVLVGIHAFFGSEVIRRGVIFADLAIGQMAALGVALGLVLNLGGAGYLLALGFALSGAFLVAFASLKVRHKEAFIGLIYAFGAAMIFVVLSRHAEGAEVFKRLLAADLLFTPIEATLLAAGLYAAIGLLLWRFYARSAGVKKELWFYGLFALTVTSSVQLAGVLTVFALLIAPALAALSQRRFSPLLFAWAIGTVLSIAALMLSWYADLPTGYTLVALLALAALAASALGARQP